MKNISSALVKAQKSFAPALKTNTNPHFRSKYVGLDGCVEAVIDALNDNGIFLLQQNHECNDGVIVETIFIHESGEQLSAGKLHVPASKFDAQGFGSALTYARRYSLMAACGIAPEDDDGNAASKPKIGNIASSKQPLAGALDNFNPEEVEQLKEIAAEIVDFATRNEWDDAFATYDNISDNDKRVAVWSILSPNSAVRAQIKKIGESKRKAA